MTSKELQKQEDQEVQRFESVETDATYVPHVDIRDGKEEVLLLADLPGVAPEAVDVTVENGVLRIEGKAHAEAPEGYRLVGQEFGVGRFRREFALGEEIDVQQVKAQLRDGRLTVALPKREGLKTRKIEINA